MAKANKAAASATAVQAPQVAAAPQVVAYTVTAPKRPLTGLKFGANGNAATHAALAAAAQANGGTLTHAQAAAVCKSSNHAGFLAYAITRLRVLVPVQPQ